MSCLGVHFALTEEQAKHLLAARSNEAVLKVVKDEIEAAWNETWLQETGKAWDAIHRCLTDGSLLVKDTSPLAKCVLGGCQLYCGSNCIVSFLNAAETSEVCDAIQGLDQIWLREKYFYLNEIQVGYPLDEDGFDATWSCFKDLKDFFQQAAQNGRSVVFTVDQ
jgi:hypothetical protein